MEILHVSLNSLPPFWLLWSEESGVQGHIIAYWTVQPDCTSSAHGSLTTSCHSGPAVDDRRANIYLQLFSNFHGHLRPLGAFG